MYTEKDFLLAKRTASRRVLGGVALAAAFLAGVIVLNIYRLQYAEMALAALGFCVTYFIWYFKVSPWVKYNRFLKEMRAGQRRQTECEFVSATDETRVHDGVEVHELMARVGPEEEDERLFFWDADKPRPALSAGDRVRVSSFGNFVVDIQKI